jgi:hypothetical protein
MGNSQKLPSRPRGVSEEKKSSKNPVRKKKAQNIISLVFTISQLGSNSTLRVHMTGAIFTVMPQLGRK